MSSAARPTARAAQRRRRPEVAKGDLREQALLDATEALLHERGVGALTVDSITKNAKLTRTAFYFYFASKEEAVGRLAERYLGEIFEASAPVFDPDVPIESGLRVAIDNQVDVWAKHGRALAAVADLAGSNAAVREMWMGSIEQFVEPVRLRIVELDREQGIRRSRHARQRAEALVWMLERSYYVWASGHYDYKPKVVADSLYEVALRILGAGRGD